MRTRNLNPVALLISIAVPLAASAAPEWRTAPVTDILILETNPVQYEIVYEQRCNDSSPQAIRIEAPGELVLGVAVKRDSTIQCGSDQPIVTLQKLRMTGTSSDPAKLKPLH